MVSNRSTSSLHVRQIALIAVICFTAWLLLTHARYWTCQRKVVSSVCLQRANFTVRAMALAAIPKQCAFSQVLRDMEKAHFPRYKPHCNLHCIFSDKASLCCCHMKLEVTGLNLGHSSHSSTEVKCINTHEPTAGFTLEPCLHHGVHASYCSFGERSNFWPFPTQNHILPW